MKVQIFIPLVTSNVEMSFFLYIYLLYSSIWIQRCAEKGCSPKLFFLYSDGIRLPMRVVSQRRKIPPQTTLCYLTQGSTVGESSRLNSEILRNVHPSVCIMIDLHPVSALTTVGPLKLDCSHPSPGGALPLTAVHIR